MGVPMRAAVLVSGSATTMYMVGQAIRFEIIKGVKLALCIASQPGIVGLERARELRMPDAVIARRDFTTEEAFGDTMLEVLRRHQIDLVLQYGWLAKTPTSVIAAFRDRMVNQHPGPLDPPRSGLGGWGMYGIRVHAAVLHFLRHARAGEERNWQTEVVAQRVDEEYDRGAVLFRASVPVYPDDTPEILQKRAISFEYAAQIATLQDFAADRVTEKRRPVPFVQLHEYEALRAAKKFARQQYPHS